MANNEQYRRLLVWAEREHHIDVVAIAVMAGLSRQDFVDSIADFYSGDEDLQDELVSMWDKVNYDQ